MITQTGLTRLVARLEQPGLLERRADPVDARAIRLTLTDNGLEVQRRVGAAHAQSVASVMEQALSHDEILQLRSQCDKISMAVERGD